LASANDALNWPTDLISFNSSSAIGLSSYHGWDGVDHPIPCFLQDIDVRLPVEESPAQDSVILDPALRDAGTDSILSDLEVEAG
jgi:hypothetical protein